MDDFIKAVKQVEDGHPGSEPAAMLKRLRRAAGLNDALIQHFLGNADSGGPEMNATLSAYIRKAVHHRVTEHGKEKGVVLTSDGTTVALMPLLLGIEAGFLSKSRERVRGLYQLTLAKDLDLSFIPSSPHTPLLGPDGCWDNLTSPQVFTLLDTPSVLTTAQLNGGMDGVILGMEAKSRHPLKLSSLLTEYYCHQLDRRGLDAAPRLISRRRRENFRGLFGPLVLSRQVVKSVELQRRLTGRSKMDVKKRRELIDVVKKGIKEFVQEYMGEHETKPQKGKKSGNIKMRIMHLIVTSSGSLLVIFYRLPTHRSSLHVACTAVQRDPHQPYSSSLLLVHPPHPHAESALSDLRAVFCRHALHAALPPGGQRLG